MPGSPRPWTPVRGLLALVACGSSFGAFTAPARADSSSAERIAITYTAEGACPREEAFVASVRRYTTKWTAVDSGAGLRSFQVRLGPRGADFAGTLAITMPDGTPPSTREIVGPDCASVARGLAVIVALAIDPQARVGASTPEDDVEAATRAPEPEPPPPEATSMRTPAAPPPATVRSGPDSVASRRRPAADARERLHFTFALEARAELTSAVVAGAVPVAAAALDVRAHLGTDWPEWLSPSLAVGARQSLQKEIRFGPGASELLWTAATIRLCPVRFTAVAGRLEIAPCAEVDVGTLRADAHGLPDVRATSTAWFDRGGSVQASYRLSPSWAVGAGVLVTAPWTRDRFALANGQLISRAPLVGVTGGVLVQLRL